MVNKKNRLTTLFKMGQAVEIKTMLLAVNYIESEKIREGTSENYDSLEIIQQYIFNLEKDIQFGIEYMKQHGEELPKELN